MLCHFASCDVSRILLFVTGYLKCNTDINIKKLLFNLSKDHWKFFRAVN